MPIAPGFVRLRSVDFPVRASRRSGKRFPTTIIGTPSGRHRHAPAVISGHLRVMPGGTLRSADDAARRAALANRGGTIASLRNRQPPRAPACEAFDSQPFHSKEDGAHGYV